VSAFCSQTTELFTTKNKLEDKFHPFAQSLTKVESG